MKVGGDEMRWWSLCVRDKKFHQEFLKISRARVSAFNPYLNKETAFRWCVLRRMGAKSLDKSLDKVNTIFRRRVSLRGQRDIDRSFLKEKRGGE